MQNLRKAAFLAAASLLASPLLAQDSSVVVIGGDDSCSTTGFNGPGRLDDGVTEGAARLVFSLDTIASQLTLTVENTSPVTPGIQNPVITDIVFNTPSAVTGMSIASQTGSGGASPSMLLTFDPDLGSNPNPNGVGQFGAFNVLLQTAGGGVAGAITNPDADTWGPMPASLVTGPVTFVLDLTGNLAGVTAFDFTSNLSTNPPGNKPQVAAVKYQSGGVAEASGHISPGSYCSTAAETIDLGGGCVASVLEITAPVMGGTCTIEIKDGPANGCAMIVASNPGAPGFNFRNCMVMLDMPSRYTFMNVALDGDGYFKATLPVVSMEESPGCCGAMQRVQVVLFDKEGGLDISNACDIVLGN
jgi:hypothetical protein